VPQKEALECHVQEVSCDGQGPNGDVEAIYCHGSSANTACRARRKHRQTVRRAERRRKDRQCLSAAILDDDLEPIYLTMARCQGKFGRRKLLGARIRLDNHELVALVDSGCEVKLALSRLLADQLRIDYSPISLEVSLPDGTRMTAARTNQLTLEIAGSHKNLTAVVVEMVAFDCILGLPWLGAASPIVNCNARKVLLPIKDGPKEVDLNHNPCRSDVSDVSLLSTAQLLKIGEEGSPLFLATIRPTSDIATTLDGEEPSPAWKDLVAKFEDFFPDDHPGLPPGVLSSSRSSSNPVLPYFGQSA
jgi:Retroviral aspartyl protease